jgi:hypothetical protein
MAFATGSAFPPATTASAVGPAPLTATPAAPVPLPDVIKALEDQHGINVGAAAEVLTVIGPDAKEAVPALLKAWEKTTVRAGAQFRNTAVGKALKAIDPEAAAKAGVE